ncbi:MAG: hypothetical protein AAGG38_08120 [Planctomycetota bacterium]
MRPSLNLQLDGKLTLESEGHTVELTADGQSLTLSADSMSALRSLAAAPSQTKKTKALRALADTLERQNLDLTINLQGQDVARLGANVKPDTLARLFSLGPVNLESRAILRTLLRPSDPPPPPPPLNPGSPPQ